jgi:hypothetical protein
MIRSLSNLQAGMITKDSIEQAYCFFHQKWRIYSYSIDEAQKEEIIYAVSSYTESMNSDLYARISAGKENFLCDYSAFDADMPRAMECLERLMKGI